MPMWRPSASPPKYRFANFSLTMRDLGRAVLVGRPEIAARKNGHFRVLK